MAHAHRLAGARSDGSRGFSVAATAIPAGVLCRSCGRLHLPARLRPLAICERADGSAEIELCCVHCDAIGTLDLDGTDTTHRALLEAWHDQRTADDTKASS